MFSVLGFMAKTLKVPVGEVVTSGKALDVTICLCISPVCYKFIKNIALIYFWMFWKTKEYRNAFVSESPKICLLALPLKFVVEPFA